jgi:O-antigen ligase
MLTSKALRPHTEPPPAALRQAPAAALSERKAAPGAKPVLTQTTIEPLEDQIERSNPFRKVAFYASVAFLFLRFSALSELLAFYTQVNFYLLYIFAPFAFLGVLLTGGVRRTLRYNPARYWLAFFAWMILATPFSSWKGDSVALLWNYSRFQITMLFMVAGLAMTWKDIRLIFYTLAASAVANLFSANLLTDLDAGGRITLSASGNMGNSNDLGTQFLLVLPFLLFVAMDSARNLFLRLALLPAIAYGIWIVLGTGSRGCLIALIAMFLFSIWRATASYRIAILVAVVVLAATIPLLLPGSVLSRLGSLVGEESKNPIEAAEARESKLAREYLLQQSLLYTVEHPVFGVGPGQFPNFEGQERISEGKRGQWKVTHNFLTQVSSECGIPALIFILLGLGSAMLLVSRTYRVARTKGFREIEKACFCYQLAMVGYLCAVIFLAHAYLFYLPTMIGLAIAIHMVGMRHMAAQEPTVAVAARP